MSEDKNRREQEECPIRQNGWHGMMRPEFADAAGDLDALRTMGTVVVSNEIREVRRCRMQGKTVYLKFYFDFENRPLWKRLFFPRKCFRVWKISRELAKMGIGCPKTYLSAVKHSYGKSVELTVLEGIPFPTVWEIVYGKIAPQHQESWSAIRSCVAQGLAELHGAGFFHGDCIPANLCLAPQGKLYFIDNDRTQRFLFGRKRQVMRNLLQFTAHMWMQVTPETERECRLFLREYEQATGECGWEDRVIIAWKIRAEQVFQERSVPQDGR